MKVTALIPDRLVKDVRELAKGGTLTDSLITALSEWAALERIKQLNQMVLKTPFKFQKGFTAEKVRKLNRTVT